MTSNKYGILLKNSLWNSGSFVFITIISFAILPFIIAKLSVEGYGIYILITSLIGYYGILDLGLGNALVKYVSELHEKKEFENLNKYINSAVIFQAIIGIIASFSIILFTDSIISLLNINSAEWETVHKVLNIAAIGFFFTFLTSAYKSSLQGLQLFKITSIIDSINILSLNVALFFVLYLGYGLMGAIIVNVFLAILTFFVFLVILKLKLKSYKIRFKLDVTILKKIFNFSIFVFLSKISGIFSTYIVRFIIAFFIGPAAVTYYTVPSKLVGAIGGISSSAITTIFPFTSQMEAAGNNHEIKKVFLTGAGLFTSILLPIILFITIFSQPILQVWMGKEFAEKTWLVLSIISLSSLIGSLSAIPNLIILGKGNSRLIGLFSVVTILLYIVFMPLLTNYFGIVGASISLLISSIGVILLVLKKTTKLVNISLIEYFFAVIKPHLISFVVAVIVLILVRKFIFINEYLLLLIGFFMMITHYIIYFLNKTIPIKNIINKLKN